MNDAMTLGFAANATSKSTYAHTLSLRLTNSDYRRLRRFVAAQEEALGHRLTHQAILEAALSQFLAVREAGHPEG